MNFVSELFIRVSCSRLRSSFVTKSNPANIRLDEDVSKTSWRRLDEDEYILINHTSSEDVFKTSSRYVFKMSSRRLEDQQMFAGKSQSKVRRQACERSGNGLANKHVFSTINLNFEKPRVSHLRWGGYTRLYLDLISNDHVFNIYFFYA